MNGKSLIQRVFERGKLITDNVYIATDSNIVKDHVSSFTSNVVMTSNEHISGTDRVCEAASILSLSDDQLIVNLQGDEPFVDKEAIGRLIKSFDDPDVKISSLMTNFQNFKEITNPNNVKVIVDNHNDAIYFSRLPIPYSSNRIEDFNRHIGIYAFTRESLIEFSKLERSKLEIIESLEGIRIIENSKKTMETYYIF